MSDAPWPTELRLHADGRTLAVTFEDGTTGEASAEQLRRMTPSAAERGHGAGAHKPLDMDASAIRVVDVRPVGRYAVRLVFDDGHDTGLFTWPLLHQLVRVAA